MKINFSKYQGTGNDFIMIDNRSLTFPELEREKLVHKMCDRRFGIGADGLILIQSHAELTFDMIYFNADGKEGSLCGNGGRCTAHFAYSLGIVGVKMTFNAFDGAHHAEILVDNWVSLSMNNVDSVKEIDSDTFELNTGSPHYISFIKTLDDMNVVEKGKQIRYNKQYEKEGINVNFVQAIDKENLKVYTYERGVEDETLACGTGVTAAAIAWVLKSNQNQGLVNIETKGGPLKIKVTRKGKQFKNIWLQGPVGHVFDGTYSSSK